MRASDLLGKLPDRGIWWQIAGFTLVGCCCLAVLEVFKGSEAVAFRCFETAVTRLYRALVIPIAGLIDEARKMFEDKMEIRRVARARALAKARAEGRRHHNRRLNEARQRFGVRDEATGIVSLPFTPEVEDFLNGELDDAA